MEQKKLTLQQEFDIHSKDFGVEDYDKHILILMFSNYMRLDADIEQGKKDGFDRTDMIIQKTLIGAGIQMYYEKKAKLKEGLLVGGFIGLGCFLVGLQV